MKRMFYFFLLTSFMGCFDNKDDCGDALCTEVYKTIVIYVKDSNGNTVSLDAFEVYDINSGKYITREITQADFEIMRKEGIYPLFGDEHVLKYQNTKASVNFKGFIDGNEILNSIFVVGADCCHVLLYEGETDIIID